MEIEREILRKIAILAAVVIVGSILHALSISLIEGGISKAPELAPSPASLLLIISNLSLCSQIRSYWPPAMRPPILVMIPIKMICSIYVSELVLRHVWVPASKFLRYCCVRLSEYLDEEWISKQGFHSVQLLLAGFVCVCMVDIVRFKIFLNGSRSGTSGFADGEEPEANDEFTYGEVIDHDPDYFPFKLPPKVTNVSSLPFVPIANLLDIRRRACAEREKERLERQ